MKKERYRERLDDLGQGSLFDALFADVGEQERERKAADFLAQLDALLDRIAASGQVENLKLHRWHRGRVLDGEVVSADLRLLVSRGAERYFLDVRIDHGESWLCHGQTPEQVSAETIRRCLIPA